MKVQVYDCIEISISYQHRDRTPAFLELSKTKIENLFNRKQELRKNPSALAHIRADVTQQVHYIHSPTRKHQVYGKRPGYLPTSEAIAVMLCQDKSSLSRGCVVRMTPLLSSILKYLTPSSLLSKKYLLGKKIMIFCLHSRRIFFFLNTAVEKMRQKRSRRGQWIIFRLQGPVCWWCRVSMNVPDSQVNRCEDFQG